MLNKFNKLKSVKRLLCTVVSLLLLLSATGCDVNKFLSSYLSDELKQQFLTESGQEAYDLVNNNIPFFTEEDMTTYAFEEYSDLDYLGRCQTAYACIGKEIMPTEKRGKIGSVKPTGWHSSKYDFVDGKYLFNRCHLIGYQLTGENANKRNLITGTRFMNTEGMLPFENDVAEYIKNTNNHVLYRVTPIFEGNDLVARYVIMEAKSVEDNGEGICFNVVVYNIQPGVHINYATGDNYAE